MQDYSYCSVLNWRSYALQKIIHNCTLLRQKYFCQLPELLLQNSVNAWMFVTQGKGSMRNCSLIIGYIQKANGLNAEWFSSSPRSLSDHTHRVNLFLHCTHTTQYTVGYIHISEPAVVITGDFLWSYPFLSSFVLLGFF